MKRYWLFWIISASLFLAACNKSSIQPEFDDLKRRDWYEDLKRQEALKNDANFRLNWIASRQIDQSRSPQFRRMLAEERKAHKANYEALSSTAGRILAAKKYPEYQKLKAQEDEILSAIEAQKLHDENDVAELRLNVGEFEAERLEIEQRYQ